MKSEVQHQAEKEYSIDAGSSQNSRDRIVTMSVGAVRDSSSEELGSRNGRVRVNVSICIYQKTVCIRGHFKISHSPCLSS